MTGHREWHCCYKGLQSIPSWDIIATISVNVAHDLPSPALLIAAATVVGCDTGPVLPDLAFAAFGLPGIGHGLSLSLGLRFHLAIALAVLLLLPRSIGWTEPEMWEWSRDWKEVEGGNDPGHD